MLTRREVFGLGTMAAAALAVKPLAGAEERGKPVAPAGAKGPGDAVLGKMKLTRHRIEIGLKEPFSVVHASDTHLVRVSAADLAVMDDKSLEWYDSRRGVFKDGIYGLSAAIEYARREQLPLFHTGDLLDFASRANLAEIKANLEGVDWFYACGNHEYQGWGGGAPAIRHGTSEADRKRDRAEFQKLLPNPIPFASRVINGVNFVEYDNGGFSDYTGCWQFDMMKKEFAKGLPVVVLCHMPFHSEALVDMIAKRDNISKDRINCGYLQGIPDKPNWGGRLEMTKWLREQKLLKAVLCGHLHHAFVDDFAPGVKQFVVGANYNLFVNRYDFV